MTRNSTLLNSFCFFFSIYLLFLSVQPCQDFKAGEFTLAPAETGQPARFLRKVEDTEKENHECSPFCICSCRQVPTSSNLTVLPATENSEANTTVSRGVSHQNNYRNQYLNSIWQPPKFYFTV